MAELHEQCKHGFQKRHWLRDVREWCEDGPWSGHSGYRETLVHRALAQHGAGELCQECPQVVMLFDAVRDLLWRATPYGETEDGDTAAYLLTKGTVHRLVDRPTVDRAALVEAGAEAISERSGTANSRWYAREVLDEVLPVIADAIEAETLAVNTRYVGTTEAAHGWVDGHASAAALVRSFAQEASSARSAGTE